MSAKHIWLVATIELGVMSIIIGGTLPTITAVLTSRMEFSEKEINLIFK